MSSPVPLPRRGVIRVGHMGYVGTADLDQVFAALRALLAERG